MTEVTMEDGSKVETTLPAEQVADLQPKAAETPAPEPAKAAEPEKPTAEPKQAEEPKQEPAKEPAKEPEVAKPRKATPIAALLEQRHNLEAELATERKAKADLEAKLTELSQKPQTAETADKMAALAAKYDLKPEFVKELVDAVREGNVPQPALPKEVQDLLAERAQAKALEAETSAFNNRVDKLSAVLSGEPIGENRERLMELAYSTERAPDGERYCDKELSELYFGFIKPVVEPGRVSAEASRRAPVNQEIVDFQQILDRDDPKDIEDMPDATFRKYQAWLGEKQGEPPIRKAR